MRLWFVIFSEVFECYQKNVKVGHKEDTMTDKKDPACEEAIAADFPSGMRSRFRVKYYSSAAGNGVGLARYGMVGLCFFFLPHGTENRGFVESRGSRFYAS